MKKIFVFISLLWAANALYGQNINLSGRVTLTGHSEYGSSGGDCWESGTEEFTGKIWFWTSADGTWRGGSCRQCNNNGNCNNTGVTDNYTYNNHSGTIIDAYIDAWEDDGGSRCDHNSGDDCRTQKYLSSWTSDRDVTRRMPNQWHSWGGSANQFGDDDAWGQVQFNWSCAQSQGNPATFGSNTWNVYCYAGSNFEYYHGYYTESDMSFNTANRWATSERPSDASGYQGCKVPVDNHSYIHKRQGFPCGYYYFDITAHDDDIYVYIDWNGDGTWDFSWNHVGCCDTHDNLWLGWLNGSSRIEIQTKEGVGGSQTAINFDNVTPSYVQGSLTLAGSASNTTVCAGSVINIAQGSGQQTASGSYWYWIGSVNNVGDWPSSWNVLNQGQANTSSFNQTFGTSGIYAVHTNGTNYCGSWGGGVTRYVTVNSDPVAQSVTPNIASGTPVCSGQTLSATFSGGSGGCGTISDVYQYTTNGGSNWNAYTPGTSISTSGMTGSVQIRTQRTATGNGCDASVWNTALWSVYSDPEAQSIIPNIGSGTTICAGQNIFAGFSGGFGGCGTITDVYEYSTNAGSSWSAYTPGSNINTSGLSGNSIVQIRTRRVATGSNCEPSAYITLNWNVVAPPLQKTVNINGNNSVTICNGTSANITLVASESGTSYQLYNITDAVNNYGPQSGNGNNLSFATSNLFNPGSSVISKEYKIIATKNPCSTVNMNNNISVIVNILPANSWAGISNTDWFNSGNWCLGGNIPTTTTDVKIFNSSYLSNNPVINATGANCRSIDIGTGASLSFSGNGTLSVYGDWNNNGTFSQGQGTVIFTGAENANISGSSTNDFYRMTINKTASDDSVRIMNTTVNITEANAVNSLLMDEGVLLLGDGSVLNKTTAGALEIQPGSSLIINGGTFNGGNYSLDNAGSFRINSGIVNIGTSSGNELWNKNGSSMTINGGTINIASRLRLSGNAALNISNGTVNLNVVGQSSSNATFSMINTSSLSMSGGTIVLNKRNGGSGGDILINTTGSTNVTGGTFQIGSASTPASSDFSISNNVFAFHNLSIFNCRYVLPVTSVNVSNSLMLNNGFFRSSSANTLNLADNCTVTGAGNNSFVDGPLSKTGDDAFEYPVGDISGSNHIWAPIAIADPGSNTGDRFTAEYFFSPAPYNWAAGDMCNVQDMNHVSGVEYWEMTRNSGTSYPDLTLYWKNADRSGIIDVGDLCVGHREVCTGGQTAWARMTGSATGTTGIGGSGSATASGFTSYSPVTFGTKTNSNPLPVELMEFTAKCHDKFVEINWLTATETNSDYFVLEHSKNAAGWSYITTIDAAGNSNQLIRYSFIHDKPYEGTSYYRLKQTDYDGSTKIYSAVAVNCLQTETNEISCYPNPFSNELIISFGAMNDKEADIRIFDMIGSEVLNERINIEGKDILTLYPVKLVPGVYYLEFTSGNINQRLKIIKN